jgi:Malectin domain/IPT/TIG domain
MNVKIKSLSCLYYLILLALWIKDSDGISSASERIVESNTNERQLSEGGLTLHSTLSFGFSDNKNAYSSSRSLQSSGGPVTLPYRVNCGQNGTIYTDPGTGKSWSVDTYFLRGGVFDGCPNAIKRNISLPGHICITRNGNNFTYNFPVPYQGLYKVTLYFVETFFNDVGRRVFNVSAEGNKILTNFDVRASAGGIMVPINRTFTINVSDTLLTLAILSSVDRATISAIEIEDGRARSPTRRPTTKPTKNPTKKPTIKPVSPTTKSSSQPTKKPTRKPTSKPILGPTKKPTFKPSRRPTLKPVIKPTMPSLPTPKLSTVRINCGSSVPFIDPLTNNTWSADINFQNGSRYNICPAEISNTAIDTVYCSERWFGGGLGMNGTYTIPVVPGLYTVNLLFAELYYNTSGSRVFNIYLQNRLVQSNFDIRSITGGRNRSLVVPVKTSVSSSDPIVRVTLVLIAGNAKISGIEILPFDGTSTYAPTYQPTFAPTRAPTNVFETILINCGYNLPYTDSLAREFAPDQFFAGGVSASKVVPIANTVDDTLYQYDRVGEAFTYEIPVPIGSFAISFLFSENEYNATGQRLFDMTVEGELLTNIDLFQLAEGAFRATRLQVVRVVDDKSLSIRFSRSAQFPNAGLPKINAIEIELDQPHIAHAVATGPYFGTVVNPFTNKADVQLVGETSHTHGDGLSLTNLTWKEGSTILGTTANTNYSFGVGLHTIALEIKDSGGSTSKDVTSVMINPYGFPAITSFAPSSGNLTGLYPVIIMGSGFNYTASQISVMFGITEMTGSAITIINQTAIRVIAPPNVVAQASAVTVKTPLGTSIPRFFDYIGSIPIQWQEFKLLNFLEPTVGRFGPDSKLYVGTRKGRILKVTMNSDFTAVVNTIVSFVNPGNEESM